MKLSAFLISSLFVSNLLAAGVCDQSLSSKFAKKFECQSTGSESSIVTSEGRIIFISKTACVELESNSVSIDLQNPGNGKLKLDIKKSTGSSVEAKKVDRVFPSGNITKSYIVEESIKFSDLKSVSPKLSVKRVKKQSFKKDELRYIGEYTCSEIK